MRGSRGVEVEEQTRGEQRQEQKTDGEMKWTERDRTVLLWMRIPKAEGKCRRGEKGTLARPRGSKSTAGWRLYGEIERNEDKKRVQDAEDGEERATQSNGLDWA